MKAIYSDDKDKGAGHGFLRIGDAQVGNMEGLRFSIKRGTDHNCLGPGGWQPAESPFTAQRITLSDDGFDIALGPEVVDHLDTRENYRLSLMSVDGVSVVGALRVPEVTYSPVGGGQGIGIAAAPAPKPAPTPPPPPAPEPPAQEPEPEPVMDILPPPDPTPPRGKKSSLAPVLILVLLLALAGGGFAAWKFWLNKDVPPKVAENTNATQQAESKEPPKEEAKTPPQEEAKAPAKPAMVQAREHLAGKADPAESVKLARTLREDRDGADASFLLVEDAAQKGDAEAMLLTGGYFDPVDNAPVGSIKKDPAEALSWYKKAKAAGNAEADARIAALRAWAQAEAAKGSPEAKNLLTQF